MGGPMDAVGLAAQEERFAHAFSRGDLAIARPLYHPDVVYLSPTVRLFGWLARIEGVDRTLAFNALTVRDGVIGQQKLCYDPSGILEGL
jgi:hypothetical protein